MSPQKRNKIIMLIFIILLVVLFVIGYFYKMKFPLSKSLTTTTTQIQPQISKQEYWYSECLRYINQPQESVNFEKKKVTFVPPQIFCEINNDQVQLIPFEQVSSRLTNQKNIVTILNTANIFTPEYFNSLKIKNLPSLLSGLKVCLTYGPLVPNNFHIFPANFLTTKISNEQVTTCGDFPDIKTLKNIGVITTIPNISSNQPFFFILSVGSLATPNVLTPIYTNMFPLFPSK